MKLVKLSVAAAMAAGLATTASATDLTEAIQGVTLDGYVRYRMNEVSNDNSGVEREHHYKVRVGANIPVNDAVSANIMIGNTAQSLPSKADADEKAYTNPGGADVFHANFQYTGVEGLTVIAGKQDIPTPFTDENHGNGALAMYNAGPVTVAAAAFDNHNAFGDDPVDPNFQSLNAQNIYAAGIIGSVDMVNFSAWYANHVDVLDAYSIHADVAPIDGVTVGARFSVLDIDKDLSASGSSDKNRLWQVYADADMSAMGVEGLNARAAYAQTNKSENADYSIAYNSDAEADFQLEQISLGGTNNAKAFLVGAGYTVADFTFDLDYLNVNLDTGRVTETVPAITYQMSDNFYAKALYSSTNYSSAADMDDQDLTRVELRYDF